MGPYSTLASSSLFKRLQAIVSNNFQVENGRSKGNRQNRVGEKIRMGDNHKRTKPWWL
jgi:hypothetical protein